MGVEKTLYSIGKLAELSNISVRTLRYYDEIGLLLPTKRTVHGHRFYSEEDVSKLHYILTLRNIGLPLETIQDAMNDKQLNSKDLLEMRLKIIQEEQEQLKRMESSIKSLLYLAEFEGTTDWKSIFETFYSSPNNKKALKKIWNQYFSEEEQALLKQFPSLGADGELASEATALFREVKANVSESPTSEIAQQLAKRWISLVHVMYKGNLELANKVWHLSKQQEVTGFLYFHDDLVTFIEQAIQYYNETNGEETSS
ncbi:MerR family transcriptional regulator [Sporosarcina thermotolerans]|uniref:MerR family transcriptional regulator n=1 Tax=Sporosarcina thermotolerans TaxID=633404 RepID=A0AAW9A5Z8_9BACL|nr:MerR family transcriptional regulator [Sporosarcina thermotolerans]MDW0116527.1 MerR family transcriptional regulator [Sporosarcina thermotolerans]WHT48749.1 MerR family transcriptional regulator [Sporosarcina thermotolerans]